MDRSSQRRLKVLVFVAGAASLATEMAGARLLAPYFGTSNVVWANVIGLTLIYLSVGYWFGGRVADRRPTARALGTLILAAAVAIAALPFATRPLFDLAATAFASVSAGAYVGSFIATMLMFGIPITALGAVAPWAIRLSVVDVATAGSISGRLYALSTIGSIVGTFIPVLLLIPAIGTRRTMILHRRRPGALCPAARPQPRCRARSDRASRAARAAARLCQELRGRPGPVRGRVAVPVRPGRRADRRLADPAPERGLGGALDPPGRRVGQADERLLGCLSCRPRPARRAVPQRRRARQRRRHRLESLRGCLPGSRRRRRRDRPSRESGRPQVLRHDLARV